jgi:hypothetical protein
MGQLERGGFQASQIVAEFGTVDRASAPLTSIEPPLICPTTLRPEPFSGRFLRLSAFHVDLMGPAGTHRNDLECYRKDH